MIICVKRSPHAAPLLLFFLPNDALYIVCIVPREMSVFV